MSFIEFKNLNFSYHENQVLLKKELNPNGLKEGNVTYQDKEITDLSDLTSACDIGYLFQNPESQIITDNVMQEIAFPLENIGVETVEIRNRVAEMVSFFGIEHLFHRKTSELSGGQKQLVNLCSLLVLKPNVLLLDEPTSQLDPIASYDFLNILRRLNEEFSITIILTDHKSDNIYPFIDKVLFLENGEVIDYKKPKEIANVLYNNEKWKYYLPEVTRIYYLLKDKYPEINEFDVPLSIREGRKIINSLSDVLDKIEIENKKPSYKNEILSCRNLYFAYNKEKIILKDVNFSLYDGDFLAIIGGNGTGKSTLLQLIAGLLKPLKGKVKRKKNLKISFIHQNPMLHFTKDTVKEELGIYEHELIDEFDIGHLLNQHPYDCSGGEQQKIVLIKALLENPDVIIMDEPTKGLDPLSKIKFAKITKKLQEKNITLLMSTHDHSFIGDYCNRCIMIFDGSIQLDSTSRAIFSNNNFYTTNVNRIVKNQIKNGIILKDVEKWVY